MSAIDVTRANRNATQINDIAKAANTQLGSYTAITNALKEFNKQAKENSKNSTGQSKAISSMQTALTTQTGILQEILKVLKSDVATTGTGTKALSVNGQQKEMAEAVKKSNQVKGKVGGELKIAPSSIQQIATLTSRANTKVMDASTKKQAQAIRTQKIAQSFVTPKAKKKVQTVSKSSGNLFGSLSKLLPRLLVGLKKILFTVFSPAALIGMIVSRFLPHIILGIAFLYGLWQGIKDYLTQIWDDLPDIIWDGLKLAREILWEGILFIGGIIIRKGIDLIREFLAEIMFKIYESVVEWWAQLKEVVSFGWNWLKEAFTNWFDKAVAVFKFGIDWVKGTFVDIKNSVLGFFKGIGDYISNFFSGIKDKAVALKNSVLGFFNGIRDRISNVFRGIKDKICNSWLGKKLGFGSSPETVNTTTNVTNTTNNKTDSNADAFKMMTKEITAPMDQMNRLIENQDKLLKEMNMPPVVQNASFNTKMAPVNGTNITIAPNDNIAPTLVRQTTNITNTQTANNKELANAFSAGVDRLVNTMNDNYQASLMEKNPPVTTAG